MVFFLSWIGGVLYTFANRTHTLFPSFVVDFSFVCFQCCRTVASYAEEKLKMKHFLAIHPHSQIHNLLRQFISKNLNIYQNLCWKWKEHLDSVYLYIHTHCICRLFYRRCRCCRSINSCFCHIFLVSFVRCSECFFFIFILFTAPWFINFNSNNMYLRQQKRQYTHKKWTSKMLSVAHYYNYMYELIAVECSHTTLE